MGGSNAIPSVFPHTSCASPLTISVVFHSPESSMSRSLFYWGSPQLDKIFYMLPRKCQAAGKNSFSWPAGFALANAVQSVISLRHCSGVLLSRLLLVHQNFHILFCRAYLSSQPQHMSFFPPRYRKFHLLNFTRFLLACSSSFFELIVDSLQNKCKAGYFLLTCLLSCAPTCF